jgi:V/A-type H+-transporting ATPase subunit C
MADMDPNVVHFNARVHGMKAELIRHETIESYLDQGDLNRMVDSLLDSPYRAEMAEALSRYEGADAIEEAVSRNLVSTLQVLMGRAHGDFRQLVQLFLARWDLMAVKSLLRCQHHQVDGLVRESSLIPGPTLTPPLLAEFASLDDMPSLVQALALWNGDLCRDLRRVLPAYEESGDLAVLEEALDRAYYEENAARLEDAASPDAQMVRGQLQAEIDRINLRLVFGQVEPGGDTELDLEALFLNHGSLPKTLLRRMAQASDPAAAMEQLGQTRYAALVEELYPLLQTGRFSPMARFFDRLLMRAIRRSARTEVFGIAVMMDYVWLKYNEVINLRLVARGLAGNLPPGRVRDELYAV